MLDIREYLTESGKSPFAEWFDDLDPDMAARVVIALARVEQGYLTDVKPVGNGVFEHRMHFGPGFRIYFGKEGSSIIILLCAGSKRTQQRDIKRAQKYWNDYQSRKGGLR